VLPVTLERQPRQGAATSDCFWGRVLGEDHYSVSLCAGRSGVFASMATALGNFDVAPVGNGVHVIRKMDTSNFRCGSGSIGSVGFGRFAWGVLAALMLVVIVTGSCAAWWFRAPVAK
jgi:hypothetical protein